MWQSGVMFLQVAYVFVAPASIGAASEEVSFMHILGCFACSSFCSTPLLPTGIAISSPKLPSLSALAVSCDAHGCG